MNKMGVAESLQNDENDAARFLVVHTPRLSLPAGFRRLAETKSTLHEVTGSDDAGRG